jgi:hypothetical protein
MNLLFFRKTIFRLAFFILCAIGISIPSAHFISLNASTFDNQQGYVAIVLLVGFIVLVSSTLILFDLLYRNRLPAASVNYFYYAIFFISLPGIFTGLSVAYEVTRYELGRLISEKVEQKRIQNVNFELRKKFETDWKQEFWRNQVPLCLNFEEKGLTNSCPAPLAIKYCWHMPAGEDWGVKHTNCATNEYKWAITIPGFTSYELRPWCRSYGFCSADAKVLCAVKSSDLADAKAKCD